MTVTDAKTLTPAAATVDAPAPPAPIPDVPIRRRVIAISAFVLLAVVAIWALFEFFEGTVADGWYHMRQRALASDFNAPHEHSGRGRAIAIMQSPAIGLNVVVAEGSSPEQLRSGPGHRMDTAALGSLGNSVIVGHHDDWGGPFARLDGLKRGDFIAVQTYTRDAILETAVYEVQSVERVAAHDVAPFATTKDFRLTLITGRGGRFSDDRVVVTAVSGKAKKKATPNPVADPSIESPSVVTASGSWLVLFAGVVAALAWLFMRRRYRAAAVIAVLAPFGLLALLGVLLDLDLLLPALR